MGAMAAVQSLSQVGKAAPSLHLLHCNTSLEMRVVMFSLRCDSCVSAFTQGCLCENPFMIKTFDEAYQFVLEHKVCTVFGSKSSPYPSLWDNTGLSEKKPKAGGWSPKVVAVWDWKTRIPQTYPDSVFY